VDLGLVEELQGEAQARVAAVQDAVREEQLRTELLTERLRSMVWDSMAVKGAVISALRSSQHVHNFPLTQPGSHERVLKQVSWGGCRGKAKDSWAAGRGLRVLCRP
jgi:hypothetical protein